MAIITLNNNSLSSVTALPAGVGGKVLQVVATESSTEVTQSSPSNGTVYYNSNLSASITPSSSSSIILAYGDTNVRANVASATDVGFAMAFKSVVGGTTTEYKDGTHAYHSGLYDGNALGNMRERLVKMKKITAGTTSQMTWTIGIFTYNSSQLWSNDGNSMGRIILYEVAT